MTCGQSGHDGQTVHLLTLIFGQELSVYASEAKMYYGKRPPLVSVYVSEAKMYYGPSGVWHL